MHISLNPGNWHRVPTALSDTNPFLTLPFAQARAMMGEEAVLIGTSPVGGRDVTVAYLRKGRFNRTLEIPSLPRAAGSEEFWRTVSAQCRNMGVTKLAANTFASEPFELPPLRGETARFDRREFQLDLLEPDLMALLSNSHRKNAKKALNRGCTLIKASDAAALTVHRQLMTKSFTRRAQRGENIATEVAMDEDGACLATGAGQLYQIIHEGIVVSSVLVLRARKCAYTHSSGNHPNGMKIGASALLRHMLSMELKAEGMTRLTLGGAPAGSSLAEFKAGFGAREIALPAAECQLGPAWRRYAGKASRLILDRLRGGSGSPEAADAS